jgi:hypothetical protein
VHAAMAICCSGAAWRNVMDALPTYMIDVAEPLAVKIRRTSTVGTQHSVNKSIVSNLISLYSRSQSLPNSVEIRFVVQHAVTHVHEQ